MINSSPFEEQPPYTPDDRDAELVDIDRAQPESPAGSEDYSRDITETTVGSVQVARSFGAQFLAESLKSGGASWDDENSFGAEVGEVTCPSFWNRRRSKLLLGASAVFLTAVSVFLVNRTSETEETAHHLPVSSQGSGSSAPGMHVKATSPAAPVASSDWPTWVLASSSMRNVMRVNPVVAEETFDNKHTYLSAPLGTNDPVPSGWKSIPTVNFKSYTAFHQAVISNEMPSWTEAVLLDEEDWSQTPQFELEDIKHYMMLFYELAKEHGWQVVETPGTDVENAVSHPGESDEQAYLDQGIPGAAARWADISEAQAQRVEFSPRAYAAFLAQARAQAHDANPHDVFLGGLTADLSGETASPSVMEFAAEAGKGIVDGFFFNVSGNSPSPSNASAFLQNSIKLWRK